MTTITCQQCGVDATFGGQLEAELAGWTRIEEDESEVWEDTGLCPECTIGKRNDYGNDDSKTTFMD